MSKVALAVAALVGSTEAATYYYHGLQIWQAYLATPFIPILVTLALVVDYETNLLGEPWRKHRIQSEFVKSSLMMLGTIAATMGLVVFMVSISDQLSRVTLDVAAGSTMICAGIYTVKRFSW